MLGTSLGLRLKNGMSLILIERQTFNKKRRHPTQLWLFIHFDMV